MADAAVTLRQAGELHVSFRPTRGGSATIELSDWFLSGVCNYRPDNFSIGFNVVLPTPTPAPTATARLSSHYAPLVGGFRTATPTPTATAKKGK
jgi:hypothetical protein